MSAAGIMILILFFGFLCGLLGFVRGHGSGYNQAREIWDPNYQPITLKRQEHEDFKAWQELKKTEELL